MISVRLGTMLDPERRDQWLEQGKPIQPRPDSVTTGKCHQSRAERHVRHFAAQQQTEFGIAGISVACLPDRKILGRVDAARIDVEKVDGQTGSAQDTRGRTSQHRRDGLYLFANVVSMLTCQNHSHTVRTGLRRLALMVHESMADCANRLAFCATVLSLQS